MAYEPSFVVAMLRSCSAFHQAWTWAPKRNQVFSASLISRDGPRTAKTGTGDVGAGLSAGAASCSFWACGPPGVDCADAAAAAESASNDAHHDALLAFQIHPMSSSSLGCLLPGSSPSRAQGPPCSPKLP